MNREQFLANRKTGIGGSDVGAILGLSPFKTPYQVWLEKTCFLDEEKDTLALKKGRELERPILEHYSSITEKEILVNLPCLRSKEYPFLIGNIDAKISRENVLIEAKSCRFPPSSWAEGIPPYYKAQVAHYAHLADAEWVDVAVLFNSWKESPDWHDFRIFPYYRDRAFEEKVKKAAIDFWQNYVLTKTPPPIKSTNDAAALYPEAKQIEKQANAEVKAQMLEYEKIQQNLKQLTEKEEQLKFEIMKFMGEANTVASEQHCATWKNSSVSRVDLQKLKLTHPSIYAECLKQTSARTFKLKRINL